MIGGATNRPGTGCEAPNTLSSVKSPSKSLPSLTGCDLLLGTSFLAVLGRVGVAVLGRGAGAGSYG